MRFLHAFVRKYITTLSFHFFFFIKQKLKVPLVYHSKTVVFSWAVSPGINITTTGDESSSLGSGELTVHSTLLAGERHSGKTCSSIANVCNVCILRTRKHVAFTIF